MSVTVVNLKGITEFDFPSSVTATLANGIVTLTGFSSGSGTVTSVAMTGDGVIFNATVGGSPVTTSGTLVPALLTQTANRILSGPTTGAAAAPTFRALVTADLPTITLAGDVTGASGANTVVQLQGRAMSSSAPSGNDVLTWNSGTSMWTPTAISAIPNANAAKIQSINVSSTAPTNGQTFIYSFANTQWQPTEVQAGNQCGWRSSGTANVSTGAWGMASVTTQINTQAAIASTATEPQMNQVKTSATATSSSGFGTSDPALNKFGVFRRFKARVALPVTTSIRVWIGMSSDQTLATWRSDTPAAGFVGFRYSTAASDTGWVGVAQVDATHQSKTTVGPAIDTAGHDLEVYYDGTQTIYLIDGVNIGTTFTLTTNLPSTSTGVGFWLVVDNVGAANAREFDVANVFVQGK